MDRLDRLADELDLRELRRVAHASVTLGRLSTSRLVHRSCEEDFRRVCTPRRVLQLIDRLESAEAVRASRWMAAAYADALLNPRPMSF